MNSIHATADIDENVVFGDYNHIGKNVVIKVIGNNRTGKAFFGDNNIINDNTRIFVHGSLKVGDWNVFHNDMLIMASDYVSIGHNCWFGQNTILDGAGGLGIGNGVRVGMYSQIWTHVASGEQIEGCTLYSHRPTKINDDVWLVGSCIVGSGLILGKRSIVLINSVLTKDTVENKVYAGSPAKLLENANFYVSKSIDEKYEMLKQWLKEFALEHSNFSLSVNSDNMLVLENRDKSEKVVFNKVKPNQLDKGSHFFLDTKEFVKTNSESERKIYKYLYNNKARFIPIA